MVACEFTCPYNPDQRSANPLWLREVLGPRIRVLRGEGPTWEIARSHADLLLAAMQQRFGMGQVRVVFDSAQQQKCGPVCQSANPDNALQCQCQCGGENHGGLGGWTLRGDFAIRTEVIRRVWDA